MKMMKKGNFLLITLCLLVLGFSVIPAHAGSSKLFTWSGTPIVGEDPGFLPSGEALFEINGYMLTITLTNLTPGNLISIGHVLTALTWDITDTGVTLTPLLALIPEGSYLVGENSGDVSEISDLSSEWGFKSDIAADSIGSFGISTVGDINFGEDEFGPSDRFDADHNLFPPPSGSLNGIEGGIVGPTVDFTANGFVNQGPFVDNQMVFTFDFTGNLSIDDITNVQALYGTDGAPVGVPEPATLLLVGSGLLGGAFFRKRLKG